MDTRKIAIAVMLLAVTGCAAVKVPPNVVVATRADGAGTIRSVDFSYSPATAVGFSELKLCVAENVSNDAVVLTGDSHVFATRWGIINGSDTNTVGGGEVFKYADDQNQVLIANGTTEGGGDSLGIVVYKVKYQLRGDLKDGRVGLVFSNIKQVQTNSGSLANSGFRPVGTWAGGGAMRVYSSLQTVAENIKTCL